MARSLVSASLSLRNVLTLPKCATLTRLCHSVPEVKDNNEISAAKQLFLKLQSDNNPLSLITTIEANRNDIDARHVLIALTSMQKFYENSNIPLSEVHKSIQFNNMCSILKRHLIKLDLPQTIQAIKVLNLLKIPSTTMIMQSLLQLIRQSINDLTLQQIFYLSFLLKLMYQTPLNEAILKALPEVFVAQLELQLDKGSIKELKNALWFATSYVQDEKSIKYIVDALIKNTELHDVDTIMRIYISLCNSHYLPDNYEELLIKVENKLMKNVSLLEQFEINKILTKTLTETLYGKNKFYNPEFIDVFINKFISSYPDFDKAALILNKLNKCKHINIQLLNYLTSLCYKNPMILSQCRPFHISNLVAGMAFANYKPPFWNELQKIFVEHYNLIPDDVTLCYFTLHLLSLDCFDSQLVKFVFSLDIDPKLISFAYRKVLQQLYQSIKTLYPTYTGPWPSEEMIQSFETLADKEFKTYPFKSVIEKLVGGPTHVNTNVQTNLGHLIDHLIVLKDGNPVAVTSKSFSKEPRVVPCVDEFDIPPDTERVAVLVLPPSLYGKNNPILQAPARLNIKSLKAMSYKVVPLSNHQWSSMLEFERLQYLQLQIGIKKKD
ncbi:hypothetical protein TSAR_015690 [Trichomalopsis sarcophagae]|uniref:RAP domain-containing protein n=1 Tax=Trichomalopsis sarcophagae TaxID=543379 RepID=A0A232FE69_9HYME|nr:hypothetical protein TSAR_015690 [Trichomalopsis sarcophagae]